MAWSQRAQTRVKNLFIRQDHDANGAEDVESKGPALRQYRLDGSRGRATGRPSFIRRIITLNGCIPTPGMNNGSSEGNNQSLAVRSAASSHMLELGLSLTLPVRYPVQLSTYSFLCA
jgi:hypothetical protein